MALRAKSFEGSKVKEGIRNMILGYTVGNYPARANQVIALTLPGRKGLSDEDGLELQFLREYPQGLLFCVEKDPQVFRCLKRSWKRLPEDLQGRVSISHADVGKLLKDCEVGEDLPALDLIFLDLPYGFNEKVRECLEHIYRRGWLTPRSVLATTIDVSGRGGLDGGIKLTKYLKCLSNRYGPKMSPKAGTIEYFNGDVSAQAAAMVCNIQIGRGQRASFSAYA